MHASTNLVIEAVQVRQLDLNALLSACRQILGELGPWLSKRSSAMTAWLRRIRSQTGHAGLVRELSDEVGHVLDDGGDTGQDRNPPLR